MPTAPPVASPALARIEQAIAGGRVLPLYLVVGDLVVAEPQAARLAEALAAGAGGHVERHRRPADLGPIVADLRTFSLFGGAKVVLAVDTAVLADRSAAAELIDQAAAALPLTHGAADELAPTQREAASRLLQALRVFGVEPRGGAAAERIDALPEWALQGGDALRRRKPRGRSKKEVGELREGLATLLEAALAAGMQGFAASVLAELGALVESGLPEGHALVLAEHGVAAGHPLARTLAERGAVVELGHVEVGKGGEWLGLQPLLVELERETGATIDRDAVGELAQRTLRASGDFRHKTVDADSTARFAAEYRKLAGQVGAGGRIGRREVAQSVEDRGEEDVWQILDAIGEGRSGEALQRYRRLVGAADDPLAERLRFFGLLAGFCRQLAAVGGLVQLHGLPSDVRGYQVFKTRWAPALQGDLADGVASPVAKLHPFRLFRAYQAAARMPGELLVRLPWLVLETELRVKGDSTESDAAVAQLIARIASARR